MRDVAVAGVGLLKFGRYPEKTVVDLAAEACLSALKDAGITMKDVQFFASGNLYQSNAMVGQRVLKEIGQTGIPCINVANACATGSTAFREAYMAVASGAYDVALAVGSEQMVRTSITARPRPSLCSLPARPKSPPSPWPSGFWSTACSRSSLNGSRC